jgi:type IV pilus assembly protein PilB
VLREAVDRGASDLHLDPTAEGTRCRFRIDGYFENGPDLPPGTHERLVARIKVLAGLTVYRRDTIQEGSIRREGGVDLRVSVLPTVSGEKVTVRIFDPRSRPLRLADLGFRREVECALGRFADLRQGTVLVCGPSGSGKTTTLYAMLHRILQSRGSFANLCSVEDPVELALDGVHQMLVRREQGLTFARGLAALLRQDPEVILVGEVRDGETAGIAVEAGMTGHLVLSSVHAGSAGEALTRLLDLAVEPYLAASSVKAVVSQRLVRQVCDRCAGEDRPDRFLLESFGLTEGARWRRGAGCDACRGTGFSGRLPIAEVLEVDRATADRIIARDEAFVLARGLLAGRTLLDDGIARARHGETTLEEVARVVDPPEARG